MIKTQKELRRQFWESFPNLSRQTLPGFNPADGLMFTCDTRCAWVDWIDGLARSGEISAPLADRATLTLD